TRGSFAPRVPRETAVSHNANMCTLHSLEWVVRSGRAGRPRKRRPSMATETSAAKRHGSRPTAGDDTGDDTAGDDAAGNEAAENESTGDDAAARDAVTGAGEQEPETREFSDPVLADISAALLQLRRLWA